MSYSNVSCVIFDGVDAGKGSRLLLPHLSKDGGNLDSGKDAVTIVTPHSSTEDQAQVYYSTWVRRRY